MSKRKLNNLYLYCYEFIWVLLISMPLFAYILNAIHYVDSVDFYTYITSSFINLESFNLFGLINDLINSVFGVSLTSSIISWFCTYYFLCELMHLIFDLLMFIPRVCGKFLRRFAID